MRGNVRVHQKKIIAKRRKKALIVSSVALSVFAIVVGGFAFLTHADFVRVEEVRVTGNVRLSEEYVQSVANGLLEGKYLGMFSRRAVFLYPHDAIEGSLSDMPVVKGVRVGSEGLRAIEVALEERGEVARFCDGEAGDFSQCFAVDEEGFVFSSSGDSSLIAYRDASVVNALGKSLLTSDDFKSLQFFMRELGILGVAPREIVIGEAGYVTVFLGGGGRLIVNTVDDLSDVLSNLSSVLNDKSLATSSADFLSRLDYMRLDAGNKVFYKAR